MATKQRSQPNVHVTEDLASSKIRKVDSVRGVIEGVKLIGSNSKNGRVYPANVLSAAVNLYEGVRVNVDHPVSGNPASPRQYRDRIGVMRNARVVENSGIYADFHYNPKHALADQLAWDAENNPESLGFSHNALTRMGGRDSQGREIVEQIVSVRHVDLVADPATTKSLFESEIPMNDQQTMQPPTGSSDPLEMIVDSIAAQIGEIAKADGDPKSKMKQIADLLKKQDKIMALMGTKPEGSEDKPAEEHALLISRVTNLTQQLEQYQAKERLATLKATIEQELATAGLAKDNPAHVSELFMKQLLTTEAVADRAALIKDRATLVGAAGKGPQFQQPQSQGTYTPAMEQSNDPNYWFNRVFS